MTSRRVLIRLYPPLIGDLLARLVRGKQSDGEVEVTTDVNQGDADILITSGPVPPNAPPTVIVLNDPIAPGTVTVHKGAHSEEVEVLDLDAIASVVGDLCGPSSPAASMSTSALFTNSEDASRRLGVPRWRRKAAYE